MWEAANTGNISREWQVTVERKLKLAGIHLIAKASVEWLKKPRFSFLTGDEYLAYKPLFVRSLVLSNQFLSK